MDAVENDPASYQPVSLICRVYLTGKLTRMPPVLRGESVEQLRLVARSNATAFGYVASYSTANASMLASG